MKEITLDALETVMNQARVDFPTAKQALLDADGDVETALRILAGGNDEAEDAQYDAAGEKKRTVDEIVEKLKSAVKTGNVERIIIRRNDDVLLNVPVNVGLVGGLIGLTAAPWAMIAAAVAAYGFSCTIEILKKDGTTEEIISRK